MAGRKCIQLDAFIDEDTFRALESGEAVFNNGLRSKNGTYWPDQPDFHISKGTSGTGKGTLVVVGIAGVGIVGLLIWGGINSLRKEMPKNKAKEIVEKKALERSEAEVVAMNEMDDLEEKQIEEQVVSMSEYKKRAEMIDCKCMQQ